MTPTPQSANLDEVTLKACPFCGRTDSEDNAVQEAAVYGRQVKSAIGGTAWRIECACGAQGRTEQFAADAIAAWNTRQSSQPLEPQGVDQLADTNGANGLDVAELDAAAGVDRHRVLIGRVLGLGPKLDGLAGLADRELEAARRALALVREVGADDR